MAYTTHDLQDTIVALATPPGVGAIGVIRLSGKQAIEIVNQVFPAKDLHQQATHTVHFGTIRDSKDRIVDEVLVTLFVAPKSYTGENVVEISCHGSDYIIQQLIELFISQGARLAQAGEFTMRAFLNGQMDLSQAEAVADLIASSSETSHTLALKQMRGGISDEIQQLRQQLIDFASLIELELDFGEEDVEFANRDDLRELIRKIQTYISTLLQSFQLGNAIKHGVSTVIAGRPNAGKSTLLNALLNEERAIVSEIAGTTRDTIEEVLNIKGIRFRVIDTAGIREAADQIEVLGVAKTMEKVRESSLLVYVYDVTATSEGEVERDLAQLVQEGVPVVVVANKVDLAPSPALPLGEGRRSVDVEVVRKWMTANVQVYETLKAYAREMRKAPTKAEEKLWHVIRKRQIGGHKFRRQHIIGHFIPDFVCLEEKLIIELDGNHHQLPDVQLADEERTKILEASGYTVLRFKNDEVLQSLPHVVKTIRAKLQSTKPQPTQAQTTLPSPGGRAGDGAIYLSAKDKTNIHQLKDQLYQVVISDNISLDNTIVSNARHYEALRNSSQALDDVLKGMDNGVTSDFIAMDIRRSLHHLGEITGEISTDDLLGNIFSRFCIGK